MRKKTMSMKKTISIIVAAFILFAFSFTLNAGEVSAATIKYKGIYNCYKVGNSVYCGCFFSGLYKVNLKTKKVKTVKKQISNHGVGQFGPQQMMRYKNYLYYGTAGEGAWGAVYRVSLKTDKVTKLVQAVFSFTIKNKKLYCATVKNGKKNGYRYAAYYAMTLNGKNIKRTQTAIKQVKEAKSNAKGYKLVIKDSGSSYDDGKIYLKTPKGYIYIAPYCCYKF